MTDGLTLRPGADRSISGAAWDYRRLAGLASHRRGWRRYGAELSPRERQVAELAANGTNSQIARKFVRIG